MPIPLLLHTVSVTTLNNKNLYSNETFHALFKPASRPQPLQITLALEKEASLEKLRGPGLKIVINEKSRKRGDGKNAVHYIALIVGRVL